MMEEQTKWATCYWHPHSCAGACIFPSDGELIRRSNGAVLSIACILISVYASEAELAAPYKTAQGMVPLRNALAEMGWPQLRFDSSIAVDT